MKASARAGLLKGDIRFSGGLLAATSNLPDIGWFGAVDLPVADDPLFVDQRGMRGLADLGAVGDPLLALTADVGSRMRPC